MNSVTIERLILSHIARWEHFDPALMGKDNVNFKPPKKGVWGRVTVLGGINHINSMSDEPCVLEVGTLIVQLFTTENSGTVAIKTQADSLAKHLKAKQLERLELLAPSIISVPSIDGIYQINVSVPYRYY
ncbi:DUF4128 domain-containing protein [Moraxella sp. Tifton1]|uniref:phage tail terminator-like protein n=1 Tax=Moraxella oculi TaxID=2940516 RepID=UPI0020112903|nr:phage tail terminator-like protein [Moraxella sp. Tifton1]MCL1623818.1 DUF4128 domain-containing protein [Moraxella sp. Tifton1]